MSTSGIEDYLQSGRPVMRDLPRERRPLFLIADVSSLQLQRTRPSKRHSLMADDIEVLRNNFIPQWGGDIWVAGKKIGLAVAGAGSRFEILVPGTDTVEVQMPVVIDGIRGRPGASVELGTGMHTVLVHQAPASVILRWGVGLYRPAHAPVPDPVFVPLVLYNDK